MNWQGFEASILLPALAAGLLVAATHVPLGIQVLKRGIVFIDLAVAQIAALGVVAADALGFDAQGFAAQLGALTAALAAAFLLRHTERRWPEVQEAIIGVAFVLAATAAILALAKNPHGSEHLRDLLSGQILWVSPADLPLQAVLAALVLCAWLALPPRLDALGFYLVFACAVTVSVQVVGIYLVFATLIVPALGTHAVATRRIVWAYAVAGIGYVLGLFASAATDAPSGPAIVWVMAAVGVVVALLRRQTSTAHDLR